jgi:hypothetical protein
MEHHLAEENTYVVIGLTTLKRGLLVFWAVWLTFVFVKNTFDGLKALGALPEGWRFASKNYGYMWDATRVYNLPAWMVGILFAGATIWEGVAATLMWRAAGVGGRLTGAAMLSFAVSLALWAAFMLMDEIFNAYQVENTHTRVFIAQLATLLVVGLL